MLRLIYFCVLVLITWLPLKLKPERREKELVWLLFVNNERKGLSLLEAVLPSPKAAKPAMAVLVIKAITSSFLPRNLTNMVLLVFNCLANVVTKVGI